MDRRTLLIPSLVVAIALAIVAAAPAQTTQPAAAPTAPSRLEVRAMQEFNLGNYATALPMLQQVERELQNAGSPPERLGPIQEAIRVAARNVSGQAQADPQAPPTPSGPRQPLAPPKPGTVTELTIRDLGNFEFDADRGGNIPQDVKAYHGAQIRVRGFMIPMDQAENITQFALVPDLFACCFGQPPQLQHTVVVNCPKGKAVSYYPDEIICEGTLKVEEKKEDGFIVSIFQLQVSSVKPAAK